MLGKIIQSLILGTFFAILHTTKFPRILNKHFIFCHQEFYTHMILICVVQCLWNENFFVIPFSSHQSNEKVGREEQQKKKTINKLDTVSNDILHLSIRFPFFFLCYFLLLLLESMLVTNIFFSLSFHFSVSLSLSFSSSIYSIYSHFFSFLLNMHTFFLHYILKLNFSFVAVFGEYPIVIGHNLLVTLFYA